MPRFVTRTHSEDLTPDHLHYIIHTEGSVDPFNEEIVIENTGNAPIESPVITVNSRFNWSTPEDMVREITRGCETDEEKAMAIFNFVRSHGNHQYSGDIQSLNPTLFFNVFGYGICAYFASAQTGLAKVAGLEARVWEIYRHTVGEIFYDGKWHMLDPDMQLFFLDKDNRSVASIEDIEKDMDFYARTHAYQRTFEDAYGNIRNEHQSRHDTFRYDIAHPRYVQYDYDPYIYAEKTMDYTLFPGETITRAWKGNGKHNDYREEGRFKLNEEEPHKTWPPVCYGNGAVRFRPRFDRDFPFDLFEIRNLKMTGDGLIVDIPQNSRNGARSRFFYRRRLPYLIVGGKIRGEAFQEGNAAYDHLSVTATRFQPVRDRRTLYRQEQPGRRRFEIDLNEFLYPGKDRFAYDYAVETLLSAGSGNTPQTATGLSDLEIVTEFQVQPRSLPALCSGENHVAALHRTASGQNFRVRVTHTWTERLGIEPPKSPRPETPEGPVELTDKGVSFVWKPSSDADTSYRFQLCLHHRCAFPLSPNFDVDLKSPEPGFHVDRMWFNPDTVYYWRVQARSAHGLWGPWSVIRSFRTGK